MRKVNDNRDSFGQLSKAEIFMFMAVLNRKEKETTHSVAVNY